MLSICGDRLIRDDFMYENLKYNKKLTSEQFKKLTNLPLDEKIELSKEIIVEFYENIDRSNGEKVYIACSFGKDSIVIVDLVRSIYPDIPIIHSDTGLEYKGTYDLKKEYENVITVKPIKPMEKVIEEDGYILPIGKSKSKTLRRARDSIRMEKWDNASFKRLSGKGNYKKGSLYNEETALKYIVCPFKISEKCDEFLKKRPLNKFIKENNFKYYFSGITYDESPMRNASLRKEGFNIMKTNCRLIGHWNVNDVLEYIFTNNLKYSDSYGEIIQKDDGTYDTTLFKRNGCFCCPCGVHLEKEPNRYQLLYYYDYDAWKYALYDLGFKQVLDYFEVPYYPQEVIQKKENKSLDNYL